MAHYHNASLWFFILPIEMGLEAWLTFNFFYIYLINFVYGTFSEISQSLNS